MINQIREYIKAMILEADPDLKENTSAFYDGDIGETILDSSYQISINSLNKTFRTDYTERTMAVMISIFGLGYRSEIVNYDFLLDRAICIEDKILDLQNFANVETISNITSNGIEASRLPSNDDAFKIDINLTLTQAYTRE
jgi:hypothetical protein